MVSGRGKLTPQDEEYKKIISTRLNRLLSEYNIKQSHLADKLSIPRSSFNEYVKGNTLPNPGNVQKIADYFGLMKSDIDPRFKKSESKYKDPQSDNRLLEAMNRKGLNRYELFMKTIPYQNSLGIEIKENDLLEYIAGTRPSDEKIYLLAKSLNVSEGWLLGYDVNMDRVPDSERGSIDFLDILIIYNQLDSERKQKVVGFARNELQSQKETK